MKAFLLQYLAVASVGLAWAAPKVDLPISSKTPEVESDWTAVYYSNNKPLLIGNDGGAATGGFRVWSLNGNTPLNEVAKKTPGRTKLVATVYDIGGKDLIITIAQTDSLFRVYELDDVNEVRDVKMNALGDWSALCPWKSSSSGEQYFFLFGKKHAIQFLIRKKNGKLEIVEVQTFDTPVEATACAVSLSAERVYFSADDSKKIYSFKAVESTTKPRITQLGEAEDDVTGLAAYIGTKLDYLLVAQKDVVAIYSTSFSLLGSIKLTGEEDIEIQGLNVYQGKTGKYIAGALTYALESEGGKGFGVSSIEKAFKDLKLDINTSYDPGNIHCKNCQSSICEDCGENGFCANRSCYCFAGFVGQSCKSFSCTNNCSGHGKCINANSCKCDDGWGGLYCSFLLVEPNAETQANGGDGDDPAIWISPVSAADSRIITTTKSEAGAGLGVFDLNGKLLQTMVAGEPNNVDIIYAFRAGDRTIDLAYAACREDNTLCLFEVTSSGALKTIPGGSQPTKPDYDVYGSCAYRSRKTGKQYLFVNAKTSEYLQYELTWTNGALKTTLVRSWLAGSGGQVEGCVSDDENGWVFIGEEPYGLWRYGAEPSDTTSHGTVVAKVGDGKLFADVEGVTLVQGSTKDKGFILVSCQGVSAYNVYKRAAPHDYVITFTITENISKKVDAVSNTDGLAVVGVKLNSMYPMGLIVTHDDSNQLPGGGTSAEASFKLVSLKDVLGAKQVQKLRLLDDIDPNWNPRA